MGDNDDMPPGFDVPSSPVEVYNLAVMFRQLGQDAPAETLLRSAMDSGHPVAAPAAAATPGMLLINRGRPDEALAVYRRALESGDPEAMPNAAFNIGVLLRKRGDLDGAEDAYLQALATGHPRWATASALSLGLIREALGDIEGAVTFLERAVELGSPSGDPAASDAEDLLAELRARQAGPQRQPIEVPVAFRQLLDAAVAAGRRFAEHGDVTALDREITIWQEIVDDPSYPASDGSFRAAVSNSLSKALGERFQRTERAEDVHAAVEHARHAVRITPEGAPELPKRLNIAGAMLSLRYLHGGDPADLDTAIGAYEDALATAGRGERLLFSYNLARALQMRHERTGSRDDLDGWIAAASASARSAELAWPGLPDVLHLLGEGLVIRYQRDSDPRDQDAAIDTYDHGAVAASESASPLLPALLVGLAVNLVRRFGRTREASDLDRAVHAAEVAIEHVEPSEPLHTSGLFLLGRSARLRYVAHGRLPDLERAIEAYRRAVEKPGAEHDVDLAVHLAELAASLSDRSEATGDVGDLHAAVDVYRRAVDAAAEPAVRRAASTGLGATWSVLYERTGEPRHLSNAIYAHEAAAREPAGDDPGLAMTLMNLGASLHLRYLRSGDEHDLDRAVSVLEQEMVNPARDVPISIARSAATAALCYLLPILAILLVVPTDDITGIGGLLEAVGVVYSVYGSGAEVMGTITAVGFVFVLVSQGASWMIISDRMQAIAAADGAFFGGFFGRFNRRLGTPVRVNVLSGVVSTSFMLVAMQVTGTSAAVFAVVLSISISTFLLSYLLVIPAAVRLRRLYPELERPFRVPVSDRGFAVLGYLSFAWVLLGSWVAVFPGTLERFFGLDYDFRETWGVSQAEFETFTLGTLGFLLILGAVGYVRGARVRRHPPAIDDASLPAVRWMRQPPKDRPERLSGEPGRMWARTGRHSGADVHRSR